MEKNNQITVFIGSDHGGYELKNQLLDYFTNKTRYVFKDVGPFEFNATDDYPDYAFRVAKRIKEQPESRGVLICRSGNGMCIAANKVDGVYAAIAFSPHHAEMARKDDNANVLCLDADYSDRYKQIELVEAFLKAEFAGMDTRHGRRWRKIRDYEKIN